MAEPDAEVFVFPPYANPADGVPLAEVIVPSNFCTHETGRCKGSLYDLYYPGEAHIVEPEFSDVETERVRVVLIGEEMGNFRLGEK